MALYTIGDLHLSLGAPEKSMEVFGGRWQGYIEKIRKGFSLLEPDDVCVLCGDFCWSMNLEQALPDFLFLNELPGEKILLKGNHDYWWSTASKINQFLKGNSFNTMSILHNNCAWYNDIALCGTRGWFYEEETGGVHDKKIMLREIGRLETSLKAAGDAEKIVFLHYPPIYLNYECPGILEILAKYNVHTCYYGHIHSNGCRYAFQGERDGINYRMISADYLNFVPLKVC